MVTFNAFLRLLESKPTVNSTSAPSYNLSLVDLTKEEIFPFTRSYNYTIPSGIIYSSF